MGRMGPADDHDAQPEPVAADGPRAPTPGLVGVIALPGIALWKRQPVVAAFLMIAGVMAPAFAILLVFQNRDDLVGLFTRTNVLRGMALVCLAAITSRLIAIWLTADTIRSPAAQRRMRQLGSAAVVALAIPTALLVARMEQVRSVVAMVFQTSTQAGVITAPAEVDPLAGQFHTVLLMGSDEGNDRISLRTDTMILALVHESGRTALVSVPRNLARLRFPPGTAMAKSYPNGFEDKEGGLANSIYVTVENSEELTNAYDKDGLQPGIVALMEGLSFSLGITIDDYAMLNSCGFVKLVDAIGGITINIDKELPMPEKLRCSNYRLTPTIGPGVTYMDGTKALGYVRSRYADSDYQRMERQRILLQTIADEIGLDDLLLRFGELADAVKDNVRTTMTVEEARTLLATLQNTAAFESVGLSPPLIQPSRPDYVEVKALMQQIRQALSADTPLNLPTS